MFGSFTISSIAFMSDAKMLNLPLTDLNPWLTNNYPSDIEMPVYKPEVCYNIMSQKIFQLGFQIFKMATSS